MMGVHCNVRTTCVYTARAFGQKQRILKTGRSSQPPLDDGIFHLGAMLLQLHTCTCAVMKHFRGCTRAPGIPGHHHSG